MENDLFVFEKNFEPRRPVKKRETRPARWLLTFDDAPFRPIRVSRQIAAALKAVEFGQPIRSIAELLPTDCYVMTGSLDSVINDLEVQFDAFRVAFAYIAPAGRIELLIDFDPAGYEVMFGHRRPTSANPDFLGIREREQRSQSRSDMTIINDRADDLAKIGREHDDDILAGKLTALGLSNDLVENYIEFRSMMPAALDLMNVYERLHARIIGQDFNPVVRRRCTKLEYDLVDDFQSSWADQTEESFWNGEAHLAPDRHPARNGKASTAFEGLEVRSW